MSIPFILFLITQSFFRCCKKTSAQSGEPNFLSKLVCIWSDVAVIQNHSIDTLYLFQIMDETQTQIAWPSKLKIGAKSKKGDCMLKGQMSTAITFSVCLHPLVVCWTSKTSICLLAFNNILSWELCTQSSSPQIQMCALYLLKASLS